MLARVLFIAVVLVGLYVLVRWLRHMSWLAWVGQATVVVGVIGLLVLFAVRGGAEVALPLLLGLVPLLFRWLRAQRPSLGSSGQSTVITRFLAMTLDHATGVMSGKVQEGRFAGCALQGLTLREWLVLWRECQADSRSVAVLEAYLDRYAEPTWREYFRDSESVRSPVASVDMTCTEAYQVLGLPSGATLVEIQAAYRRLIQRLHPDHGGSAYLTTQLNQARDLLLGDRENTL